MTPEIWLAIIAIIGTVLSAVVTHLVERAKYAIEIEKLRTEVKQLEANKNGTNLENTQKLIDIIMQQVVPPLEQETKKLRYAVNRFTRAVEKIGDCDYRDSCPVRAELQKSPAALDDEHGNANRGS